MWQCKHCKNNFDLTRTTDKANHTRHCKENPKRKDSYKKQKIARQIYNNNLLGEFTDFNVVCEVCEISFIVSERKKQFPKKEYYYCTRTCACSVGGRARAGKFISNYRTICWKHHKKKCIICNETNIVAAHHYDGDHNNNDPRNFVPLCPTHHIYVHSVFKHLVIDKIHKYVNSFIDSYEI